MDCNYFQNGLFYFSCTGAFITLLNSDLNSSGILIQGFAVSRNTQLLCQKQKKIQKTRTCVVLQWTTRVLCTQVNSVSCRCGRQSLKGKECQALKEYWGGRISSRKFEKYYCDLASFKAFLFQLVIQNLTFYISTVLYVFIITFKKASLIIKLSFCVFYKIHLIQFLVYFLKTQQKWHYLMVLSSFEIFRINNVILKFTGPLPSTVLGN